MTFYLKARTEVSLSICEMTDTCTFTEVLYVWSLAVEATLTRNNHFLTTLLNYAFDQTKGLLQIGQVY